MCLSCKPLFGIKKKNVQSLKFFSQNIYENFTRKKCEIKIMSKSASPFYCQV